MPTTPTRFDSTESVAGFLDALPRASLTVTDLEPGRRYRLVVNNTTNTLWTATYEGVLVRTRRAGSTLVMNVHDHEIEVPAAGVRMAEEVN